MIAKPSFWREWKRCTKKSAPALKVGDTVYVSGQISRDAAMRLVEGREAQIVQAFENLALALAAAGASLADVVDLTTFHTDMREPLPVPNYTKLCRRAQPLEVQLPIVRDPVPNITSPPTPTVRRSRSS